MALTATQAIKQAKKQLSELIDRKTSCALGVSKDEEGWHVSLEMLERKAIPEHMDLLAQYDVLLDEDGNIVKFERGDIRHRSDTAKHGKE
jgi:hypothetical protein